MEMGGLTLLGKIQIVKSFIIPKVLSKASLITVTEDLIKEINSLIYRFVWKGNDKIKRAALINDIEDGGLKMLDIQSMILAQRVMVLKRFADKDKTSSWKITLNYFLSQIGGNLFLTVILILKSCLSALRTSIKSVLTPGPC